MKDKKLKNRVSSLEKDMEMLKGILKSLGLNNSQDNSKELDELKSQLSKKESEIDNLKNILSKKDDEIKSLNYTISQQTIEIGTLNNDNLKLSEELNQNPLKELEIVFNSLDDKTKNGIENILLSDKGLNIFAKGILNINSIFDYLDYLNREHKDEEFKKLKIIFETIFKSYESVTNISYLETISGDEFDTNLHQRDNRSEEFDGSIEKVLLKGIKKNNEIIRKSIVRL